LYAGDQSVIVDDYKPQYVPLVKKPYWGMVLTMFSFGFFVTMIVTLQRKKRALRTVRDRSGGGHGLAVYSHFITERWLKRVI